MTPTREGSFRLFQLFGIEVFLHWSWFLVALLEVSYRSRLYSSIVWNIFEYLTLFGIVLMHEFGHSLACRQVGGKSDQIVLWPLGGVAYVAPPPRPGATLWSIAAGPLVNVILFPILSGLLMMGLPLGADGANFLRAVWLINVVLLVFNLLPIYPLDGGQILRSLLWFVVGRARSLLIASAIGLVGVAALIGLALWQRQIWLGIIAVFILFNCWRAFGHGRALLQLAKAPRQQGYACPSCGMAPLAGELWSCGECNQTFDVFQSAGVCPRCGAAFAQTRCIDCGSEHPIAAWSRGAQ